MDKLSLQTETQGGVAVVTAIGQIDSETSVAFDAELTRALGEADKLVVNFIGVDYMSSAGIRVVVKASQAAEKNGGALKLAFVPESVKSVMYTVGLNQKVHSYANVDEAIASF
jgi:anti-anti-sigma factor